MKRIITIMSIIVICTLCILVSPEQPLSNFVELQQQVGENNLESDLENTDSSDPVDEDGASDNTQEENDKLESQNNPSSTSDKEPEEQSTSENETETDQVDDLIDENPSEQSTEELNLPPVGRMEILQEELPADSAVVTTFAQLKSALANNNGITTVYLGGNITMEAGGIAIHSSKASLTVNGTNPLVPGSGPFTITDYTSATFADCITIGSNVGPKQLTVRNMNIVGKNYYGTFSVADVALNVTTQYENVTYSGPQMVHNRNGTCQLSGNTYVTLQYNGGSATQEFCETNRLIIGGNATITSTATANACFWLTGSNTSLEILAGANVSVSAMTGLEVIYCDGSMPNVTVGQNAKLNIDTKSGLFYTNAVSIQQANTFTIKNGANVNIKQAARSPQAVATIRVKGNFIVEKDATLSMIASHATADPLIQFSASGTQFLADDAARIFLYNKGGRLIDWASGYNGIINLKANNISYWRTAPSTPSLESITNEPPLYNWAKAGNTLLSITATCSNTSTTVTDTNFVNAVDIGSNPATTLNMQQARTMILSAKLPLTVESLTTDSISIVGKTSPNASLRIEYMQNSDTKVLSATADSNGDFNVPIPSPDVLEALTYVTVTGSLEYNSAEVKVQVTEGIPQILQFKYIPATMDFNETPISAGTVRIDRADPDWSIILSDTRDQAAPWSVNVRLGQELTCYRAGRYISIPHSIVFVDDTDYKSVLGPNIDVEVFRGIKGAQNEFELSWGAGRGIFIEIFTPLANAYTLYTATLEWILVDAP